MTLIQAIMVTAEARENCARAGNTDWQAKHSAALRRLYQRLPSGSGIDNGTTVSEIDVAGKSITFTCAFHHMNDNGVYDGWTEHTVRVTPSWTGIDVTVIGPDRDDILSHLTDVFQTALTETVE